NYGNLKGVLFMDATLTKISKEIGINENILLKESLKAYIRSELRKIEIDLISLYHKYGIKSIMDLEKLIENGEVNESDVFNDLTKIDYLESKMDKLKKLLMSIE
ncbi:MAG: hypothetical protein ACE5J3_12050, partial [Methanosarcinales archaeon]